MPRPLNWIRGEGTMKNQRGIGTVVVSSDPLQQFNAAQNYTNNSASCQPGWDAGCQLIPSTGDSLPMDYTIPSTVSDFLNVYLPSSSGSSSWLLIGGLALLALVIAKRV